MLERLQQQLTHRISTLPILVLMPHSRCNCRCVMCDIWKANHVKQELTTEDLAPHLGAFKELKVKRVALSGGEALLHANLWSFCKMLKELDIHISLLSTGLTLRHHAEDVVNHVDDVIVSIDGSERTHDKVRNIPGAFQKLREGVNALKASKPSFKVTGRCVIQKQNFRDFENIVLAAKEMRLDQISFLPADVSSHAFNRPEAWGDAKINDVALTLDEADELGRLLEQSFEKFSAAYKHEFIVEAPSKMTDIAQYYRALHGRNGFPKKKCNAPWISAVVEANGDVRPCFFHEAYGNLHQGDFKEILNRPKSIAFRRELNIRSNPTCKACVCALHVGWWASVR
ncbi:MAG: radical SAM protein [Cyclobacteriaceae bacterium]